MKSFQRTINGVTFAEKVTIYFYKGKRIVGVGRGTTLQEAYQNARKSAEMIDRENLPYLPTYDRFNIFEGWREGLIVAGNPVEIMKPVFPTQTKDPLLRNFSFTCPFCQGKYLSCVQTCTATKESTVTRLDMSNPDNIDVQVDEENEKYHEVSETMNLVCRQCERTLGESKPIEEQIAIAIRNHWLVVK